MPDDRVLALVRSGQPLDGLVIDAHAHIGPWFNFATPAPRAEPRDEAWDVADLIRAMDRLGIQVACISATAGIGPDAQQGNDQVAQAIARYPDRLLGYVTVNPNHPAQMTRELERLRPSTALPFDRAQNKRRSSGQDSEPAPSASSGQALMVRQAHHDGLPKGHHRGEGFIGVKMHPMMHLLPLDGPAYAPAFEVAAVHRAPVLMHTWLDLPGGDPERVGPLAERYPTVALIMGHAGGEVAGIRKSIAVARRFPNVYLDLVGSAMYAGMVEEVVTALGANRLLFGTDCTFFDARPQVGRIAFAAIPEAAKRQVLGENMRRILLACDLLPGAWRQRLGG